ncbi:MAG: TonB-dependent hemoglobin/transferrin/lactoferrin family receptor [Pseudomonadota bacterium]
MSAVCLPPGRRSPVSATLTAVLLGLAGTLLQVGRTQADDELPNPDDNAEWLTVTAAKQVRDVSEVTGAVDVIGAEQIEAELARDIKDMVRYLPGVSVRQNAGRFGLSDFTIRGLSGNRVLIEVDGVRVSDNFSIGSFSNANRNFVDLDTVKAVEIIRGSASSLYGSNAIGGVVTFLTKDPADYLNGDQRFVGLKAGYSEADHSHTETLTGAFGSGAFSVLAVLTQDQGHERDNQGSNRAEDSRRTAANPQERLGQSALLKAVWQTEAGDKLRLTADVFDSENETESYWSRTTSVMPLPNPPGASITTRVLDLDADDQQDRRRLQLDYEFGSQLPGIDAGLLQLYRQTSATRQETREARESGLTGMPPTPAERWREFRFEQEVEGVELTLTSSFALGDSKHTLTYGVEHLRTETEQLRNGYTRNPLTGVTGNVVMPDVFPVRDFPLSNTTETAIYLQDEIQLFDGRLLLVPALRHDRYRLDSRNDAIFAEDNPTAAITDLEHQHNSPKLGLLYKLDDMHSLFAQYAEGFRSPPVADVNIGFTNFAFGYTAISNPELKPEQSRNLDIGWRLRADWGRIELTAFRNDYDDFIESLVVVSQPPQTPLVVFQSQNLNEVRIEGVELRATLDLQHLLNTDGFTLRSALSHARGDNLGDDEPLASIDPDKAVLGVAWQAASHRYGFELVSTHVRGKTRVADSTPAPFLTDSYTLWDVLAHWQISDNVRVQAGLFNLGDKHYWEWADVRGQAANSTTQDRYSQPGRNGAINLNLSF